MNFKKIGKAILYPHIAIRIILIPIAIFLLIYSMVVLGDDTVIAYISYVLATYTLTIWCLQIPNIIKFINKFKNENKYVKIWRENPRLRVNVSLFFSFIWNAIYGSFQLLLGFHHHSFWFYSFGIYYICLGIMRFFLFSHTKKHTPGEKMYNELIRYRACGWIFLIMNMALSAIVTFIVYLNRSIEHHPITAIAMATYTFITFTLAIVNIVRYRKYNSPAFMASKAISLAAASVSILTLESTMFTAFGADKVDSLTRGIILGLSGGAIMMFILIMAIYMIVNSSKKLKLIKNNIEMEALNNE